jgi:hypothetical protein
MFVIKTFCGKFFKKSFGSKTKRACAPGGEWFNEGMF